MIALAGLGLGRLLAEKDHADPVAAAQGPALCPGDGLEKAVGFLQQQAAAVAGPAVGGNTAAVRHAGQRGDRRADQLVAGLAAEMGDQPEAAVVFYYLPVIQGHHVLSFSRYLHCSELPEFVR